VTVALVLAQSLPLVVRQRFPVPVFVVVLGGNAAYYLVGYPPTGLDVALVVALYTVAAHCSGRSSAAAALIACVVSVAGPFLVGWGPFWSRATLALVAYLMVFFVAGYAAGRYQRVRRLFEEERLRSLAERARREREVAQVLAVKAERTRIARELHDSVAHLLSVVAVQASAAASQLDRDSEGARRALEAVREASRQGLATMPSIVRALRADEPEGHDRSWSPPETLADLPAAVDRLRQLGCAVDLRMEVTMEPLPPGVSESALRVVQVGHVQHSRSDLHVQPTAEVEDVIGAGRQDAAGRCGVGWAVRHGIRRVHRDRAATQPMLDEYSPEAVDRDPRPEVDEDDRSEHPYDACGPGQSAARRVLSQVLQQRRLAGAGLPAHHQCPTYARPHRIKEFVDHAALAAPTPQVHRYPPVTGMPAPRQRHQPALLAMPPRYGRYRDAGTRGATRRRQARVINIPAGRIA
jgi:signal transduction histidine kinase